MAENKQFHFATETSLGYLEGDLRLVIDGNNLEGSFNAFGVEIQLQNGTYDNGHFKGSFSEVLLFTPVEGTLEGQIDGDDCTATLTTGFGQRIIKSV